MVISSSRPASSRCSSTANGLTEPICDERTANPPQLGLELLVVERFDLLGRLASGLRSLGQPSSAISRSRPAPPAPRRGATPRSRRLRRALELAELGRRRCPAPVRASSARCVASRAPPRPCRWPASAVRIRRARPPRRSGQRGALGRHGGHRRIAAPGWRPQLGDAGLAGGSGAAPAGRPRLDLLRRADASRSTRSRASSRRRGQRVAPRPRAVGGSLTRVSRSAPTSRAVGGRSRTSPPERGELAAEMRDTSLLRSRGRLLRRPRRLARRRGRALAPRRALRRGEMSAPRRAERLGRGVGRLLGAREPRPPARQRPRRARDASRARGPPRRPAGHRGPGARHRAASARSPSDVTAPSRPGSSRQPASSASTSRGQPCGGRRAARQASRSTRPASARRPPPPMLLPGLVAGLASGASRRAQPRASPIWSRRIVVRPQQRALELTADDRLDRGPRVLGRIDRIEQCRPAGRRQPTAEARARVMGSASAASSARVAWSRSVELDDDPPRRVRRVLGGVPLLARPPRASLSAFGGGRRSCPVVILPPRPPRTRAQLGRRDARHRSSSPMRVRRGGPHAAPSPPMPAPPPRCRSLSRARRSATACSAARSSSSAAASSATATRHGLPSAAAASDGGYPLDGRAVGVREHSVRIGQLGGPLAPWPQTSSRRRASSASSRPSPDHCLARRRAARAATRAASSACPVALLGGGDGAAPRVLRFAVTRRGPASAAAAARRASPSAVLAAASRAPMRRGRRGPRPRAERIVLLLVLRLHGRAAGPAASARR